MQRNSNIDIWVHRTVMSDYICDKPAGVIVLILISIIHVKWNWKVTQDKLFLSKATIEAAEPSQKQFAFVTNDYIIENSVGRYFLFFHSQKYS